MILNLLEVNMLHSKLAKLFDDFISDDLLDISEVQAGRIRHHLNVLFDSLH